MERLLMTVDEAAESLAIGRTKAYELVNSGIIPSVRFGRSLRVPLKQLAELVERRQKDQCAGGWPL